MTHLADAVDLIIFDFDGTICDSADVKTDAFHQLYLDEQGSDFANEVRHYHLEHAGVSRYDKIAFVEEQMLGRACTDDRMETIAGRFSELVRDRIISAPLVAGAETFLTRYTGAIPMVIASATPTEELRSIIKHRGLHPYFDAIKGSPASKHAIVANHLLEYEITGHRSVVVGDQLEDKNAADASGCLFVGLRPEGSERLFGDDTAVVCDFGDLAAAIVAVAQRIGQDG